MSLLGVSILNAERSLAEGGVNVDLDLSLFVQLGFFLVLLFVLKPALFDPMMKLFEERERRIEGTIADAKREDEKSAKALAKYEAIVGKARQEGATERDAIRAQGMKREAEVMAKVRAETSATLDAGRKSIGDAADAARKQLETEAQVLARQMATRVLGREVSS
ncbi:MAG: H(+)-transporting ATPase [Labilithrix sp.]|nr:H(+)-transporting ATPase [Labilithrix sp.]